MSTQYTEDFKQAIFFPRSISSRCFSNSSMWLRHCLSLTACSGEMAPSTAACISSMGVLHRPSTKGVTSNNSPEGKQIRKRKAWERFHNLIGAFRRKVENSYDIAYCVHRSYWRNGYATEMAKGMIDYAKTQGAEKMTVRVNKENVASNKVVQKLGFEVVGETSYKKRGTELEYADYLYELKL